MSLRFNVKNVNIMKTVLNNENKLVFIEKVAGKIVNVFLSQ